MEAAALVEDLTRLHTMCTDIRVVLARRGATGGTRIVGIDVGTLAAAACEQQHRQTGTRRDHFPSRPVDLPRIRLHQVRSHEPSSRAA